MQVLYSHCDHMFEIARVDKYLVSEMTMDFADELHLVMEDNREDFEIDENNIIPICKEATRLFHITLIKSNEGNMQNLLRNNFKVIEHQSRQRGGALSSLLKRDAQAQ